MKLSSSVKTGCETLYIYLHCAQKRNQGTSRYNVGFAIFVARRLDRLWCGTLCIAFCDLQVGFNVTQDSLNWISYCRDLSLLDGLSWWGMPFSYTSLATHDFLHLKSLVIQFLSWLSYEQEVLEMKNSEYAGEQFPIRYPSPRAYMRNECRMWRCLRTKHHQV